jgi:hypothetical protein
MGAGKMLDAGAHRRMIEEGKGQARVLWRRDVGRRPAPSAFTEHGTDPMIFPLAPERRAGEPRESPPKMSRHSDSRVWTRPHGMMPCSIRASVTV